MGNLKKSLKIYVKQLEIQRNCFGEIHLGVLLSYEKIANLYELMNKKELGLMFSWKALSLLKMTNNFQYKFN